LEFVFSIASASGILSRETDDSRKVSFAHAYRTIYTG